MIVFTVDLSTNIELSSNILRIPSYVTLQITEFMLYLIPSVLMFVTFFTTTEVEEELLAFQKQMRPQYLTQLEFQQNRPK